MKAYGKKTEDQIRWYLEAIADANGEWMAAIDAVPFVIGRDEDCNLKLTSKWVSRCHSEIRKSGDHLWIRDLGSTNGTFVNNKQVTQAELIEAGDIISIGKSKFNVKSVVSNIPALAEATCSMDLSEEFSGPAGTSPKLNMNIDCLYEIFSEQDCNSFREWQI